MKRNTVVAMFMLFLLASCTQNETHSNTEDLAFKLVTLCVDSTLRLDPGLNRGRCLIDFRHAGSLNRKGIDRYLQASSFFASETNADSLVLHDSTWIKYQYFENTVIVFDTIENHGSGQLLIRTSKIKASDGAISTEILLRRHGNEYECLSSKITTIS